MARSRRKKSLMRRLNTALAVGATITINWIQAVVVVAKKQWKVASLSRFVQQLESLLKKRNMELEEDAKRILANCWRCVTCGRQSFASN